MTWPPESLIYRVNNLEVDTGRGCILRDGQEVPLNPKVLRVLVHLLKERHRLVTKEELLELFWTDTAVTDDALTQCVAKLRRVLGDDPKNPAYIKTVPRIGYRFVGPVEEISPSAPPTSLPESLPASLRSEASREQSVFRTRRIRWIAGGALAVAFVGAAILWAGSRLHIPLRSVSASRVGSPEPEWWEVAWWKLNEGSGSKISDSVHGMTATLPAGVSWAPGVSGTGLLYTGCELPVHGSDPGVLPLGLKPTTLTGWIKTSSDNGDAIPILDYGGAKEYSPGFNLSLHETGAAAFWIPWGRHFFVAGQRRIRDGRWHQVTGVFDGPDSRRARLYIDGAEDAAVTAPPDRQTLSDAVQWAIGTTAPAGSPTFRGTIDDLRVYERALRADEIRSLYHCMAGGNDLDVDGGGSYYFAPLLGNQAEVLPRAPGEHSARVRNSGKGFAGIMFVRREPDCGLRSIHGANMGQDLNIEADLHVPLGPDDSVTDAGLYFRSRPANPGDGIVGGTSAGYWVRLDSTGQVRVHRLHPGFALAVSTAAAGFDPNSFHKLEAAVHGETLEVALDGRLVTFDVAGGRRTVLQIPPAWETASPKGNNGGSAGIAFEVRRPGQAGSQEARNIRIKAYQPLRVAQP